MALGRALRAHSESGPCEPHYLFTLEVLDKDLWDPASDWCILSKLHLDHFVFYFCSTCCWIFKGASWAASSKCTQIPWVLHLEMLGPLKLQSSSELRFPVCCSFSPQRSSPVFTALAPYLKFHQCRKLQEAFQPTVLCISNDSHRHAGHSGNPTGAADAETHFSVEIVSDAFEGKPLVQRHRSVYALLQPELDAGLHALQLKIKAPNEIRGKPL